MIDKRLLDLVGEVYAFDGIDEFRPGIMEVLDRAVPSAWVSYNEVDGTPENTYSLVVPSFPEEVFGAWVTYSDQNPVLAAYRETLDGRPRRISDLLDRDAFRRLDLYRECYLPMGVESQVAFTLPARPPLVVALALSRGAEDYSDSEVELLTLARPHLIQAYRTAELASARAAALHALEAGLETQGDHVVVLDPHGRVEFATATARRLLGDPGPQRNALPVPIRDWIADRRGQPGPPQPLTLTVAGTTLTVRLLPRPSADRRDVLLIEPGAGELTVAALRSLGLTAREAEALRWVALGQPAAHVAERMRIARRTVEKHLQNAYAKLGVSNAADAAATAWAAVGT
ncbi:hypothetical protein DSM104299_03312 [Baekduia alba]|uniref:helix-turn-helix transcriptional regulator n=1 Tax=Baekduia alba TaxID=2997333 RepID=UPI002341541B|nr:helix-turn-helix transcriptional regulator [Baekduia alba]WCB94575.1 hypothetical protein DSM104299_03312 [Baekduia alba]